MDRWTVHLGFKYPTWGQSYKANFGVNYIKNGFSKLNWTLNYINLDVIYARKVFLGLTSALL